METASSTAPKTSIEVIVRKHHTHDHYIAVSPDVEGFIAQGNSLSQIRERIPLVLESLLELRGERMKARFRSAEPVERLTYDVEAA